MQSNQGYVVGDAFPARIDKTLTWLTRSRDTWKAKCKETKLLLKRQTFAAKRLKDGRNEWRLSSIQLKQELICNKKTLSILQDHIGELELQIEDYKKEIYDLKKK